MGMNDNYIMNISHRINSNHTYDNNENMEKKQVKIETKEHVKLCEKVMFSQVSVSHSSHREY